MAQNNLPNTGQFFVNARGNRNHVRHYHLAAVSDVAGSLFFFHGYGGHANLKAYGAFAEALVAATGLSVFMIDHESHGYSGPADVRCVVTDHCLSSDIINIDLSGNRLQGSLPPEISSLMIRELILSDNFIIGNIPHLPSTLQKLDVENNQLTGKVPGKLNDITFLERLSLQNNKLTGTLPTDMFPTSLRFLTIAGNRLNGSIPSEIFQVETLEEVDLANNLFTGTISREWGSMENLLSLKLHVNEFNGTFPAVNFLSQLHTLTININKLTGTIPSELSNSASLQFLDLSANNFSGGMPSDMGSMASMKYLILSQNRFTGSIPTEVGKLSSLETLHLAYNDFVGEIPRELCELVPLPLSDINADCSSRNKVGVPKISCSCCRTCLIGYGT